MELNEQISTLKTSLDESFKKIEEGYASKAAVSKLTEEFTALNKRFDQKRLEEKKHPVFGNYADAEAVVNCLRRAVENSQLPGDSRTRKSLMDGVNKADLNSYGSGTGVDFVPTQTWPIFSYLLSQYGVARRECTTVLGVDRNIKFTQRNGTSTAVFTNGSSVNKDDVAVSPSIFGETAVTLTPNEISVLGRVSEKLLYQSAVNVAEMVAIDMTEQCGVLEDNTAILGDGTVTYGGNTGWYNDSNVTEQLVRTGAFGAADFDAIFNMQTKVHESILNSDDAKYYMSGAILALLRQTKASTSGLYFLPQLNSPSSGGSAAGEVSNKSGWVLGGYPIHIWHRLDKTNAVGKYPILFGDLKKASVVGIGRDMSVKVDMSRYFDSNQAAFRLTYDFGFATRQPTAVCRLKITS